MKTRIANRRRCHARVKNRGPSYRLVEYAPMQRARRRSDRCQNWALPGSRRCRLHGAFSTGARTPEGKQRQAEGRRRWLERLRAGGKKPGPPKGTGGRPRASDDPLRDFRALPEIKAKRRLTEAATRLARARSVLRHANSASAEYRRKRREAQQEAKREVQRLLEEHQEQRRAHSTAAPVGRRARQGCSGFPAKGGRERALRPHPALAQRSRTGGQGARCRGRTGAGEGRCRPRRASSSCSGRRGSGRARARTGALPA